MIFLNALTLAFLVRPGCPPCRCARAHAPCQVDGGLEFNTSTDCASFVSGGEWGFTITPFGNDEWISGDVVTFKSLLRKAAICTDIAEQADQPIGTSNALQLARYLSVWVGDVNHYSLDGNTIPIVVDFLSP